MTLYDPPSVDHRALAYHCDTCNVTWLDMWDCEVDSRCPQCYEERSCRGSMSADEVLMRVQDRT